MKNKKNFSLIFLMMFIFFTTTVSNAKGDDFYTRLFKSGKKMYFSGNYKESAKDLRIASFGLQDNPEILKELYLYYALSNFKLKRGDKVVEISDKLLDLYGVKRAEDIEMPEIIKNDLELMFSAVFKNYRITLKGTNIKQDNKRKKIKKRSKRDNEKIFALKFAEVKAYLDSNLLKETATGIKKLNKLKRGDIRTKMLKGILAFRKGDYKTAVKNLLPVYKHKEEDLNDDVCYFLSLSNYFLKNYGQTIAFYQKVKKQDLKKKLSDILNKVKKLRENMVGKNASELFNKKMFKETLKKFAGDSFIPRDIFRRVIKSGNIGIKQIKKMVDYTLANPPVYEIGFVFSASDYFSGKNDLKYAIKILKNSKFVLSGPSENLEVLYRLGEYYYKANSFKMSKKVFKKIIKINPLYKKTYFYLDNLKKLH